MLRFPQISPEWMLYEAGDMFVKDSPIKKEGTNDGNTSNFQKLMEKLEELQIQLEDLHQQIKGNLR